MNVEPVQPDLAAALPLVPSDPGWLPCALADLESIHRDHLHCERKAAQSALSLVRSYPEHERLLLEVARLAHEETRHVVQVAQLLRKRGLSPGFDHGDEYAAALRQLVRRHEPERLLDRLLVFAVIEGRSAERLRLLAEALALGEGSAAAEGGAGGASGAGAASERPAALYRALAEAELRHRDTFLSLAAEVAPAAWRARAAELAAAEARVVAGLPLRPRIH